MILENIWVSWPTNSLLECWRRKCSWGLSVMQCLYSFGFKPSWWEIITFGYLRLILLLSIFSSGSKLMHLKLQFLSFLEIKQIGWSELKYLIHTYNIHAGNVGNRTEEKLKEEENRGEEKKKKKFLKWINRKQRWRFE